MTGKGASAPNLTPSLAEEIQHKLDILCSEPDLIEDYGLTQEQADELLASVPAKGEWHIPAWGIEAVRGELKSMAWLLRNHFADDHAQNREHNMARKMRRLADQTDNIIQEIS